jgi:hypothetical protein
MYVPLGGESGRQQQGQDPGFPCSYRDIWNATGIRFGAAPPLTTSFCLQRSAASDCGRVALLKANPVFRALKLQHSIDAILRRERERPVSFNFWSPDSCGIAGDTQQTESTITAALTLDGARDNIVQVE